MLGYEAIFGGRGAGLQGLRVELFRRDIEDPRPRYENLLEPLEFLPEVEPDRVRITPESSDTEGVELLVRARAGARLDGWLAYSYARARGSHRRRPGAALARPAARRDARHRLSRQRAVEPGGRLALSQRLADHAGADRCCCPTPTIRTSSRPSSCSAASTASGWAPITASICARVIESHSRGARCSCSSTCRTCTTAPTTRASTCRSTTRPDEITREEEPWPGIFPSLGVVWEF